MQKLASDQFGLSFLFVLAFSCAIYICGSIVDPDLWWHITVGKWIIANFNIPSVDIWNTYHQGHSWLSYSWLAETLFAFFELKYGLLGLGILKLVLALLFCFISFITISSIAKDKILGSVIALVSCIACFSHFELRPQTFTWIFLTLILYSLTRENLDIKKKALWIFVLMMLWANTHISSIIGLIAIYFFSLENKLWSKEAFFLTFVGLAATFATPYFGAQWFTLLEKSFHPFTFIFIREFQPVSLYQAEAGISLLLIVVLVLMIVDKPSTISSFKFCLAVGFTLLAWTIQKFMPFALIVLGFELAMVTGYLIKFSHSEINSLFVKAILSVSQKIRESSFISITIFITILISSSLISLTRFLENPVNKKYIPEAAVDYIQSAHLPSPLLNSFDTGGYLIYRFSDSSGIPTQTVAIDGRTNVTPPEILRDFIATYRGENNWQDLLKRISPKTILWEASSPFTSLLRENTNWCEIRYPISEASSRYVLFTLCSERKQN